MPLVAAQSQLAPRSLLVALGQAPLLRDLPLGELAELALVTRNVELREGQFLFQADLRPGAFFHVLSGQIKLGLGSDGGDEKILEVHARGESFGLAELFSTVSHTTFAQASASSSLLAIPKAGLLAAMERSPELCRTILTALADAATRLERDVAAYCMHSARRRVLDYLLHRAAVVPGNTNGTTVRLDMRKHLIAARLSLTPESFSRALRDLSVSGLISVSGRLVTLEEALLTRDAAARRSETLTATRPPRERRRQDATVGPNLPGLPVGTRAWI